MPYEEGKAKGQQVETMFDSIAPAYDLMNSCMSLGMHTHWRNLALKMAVDRLGHPPGRILDVATGTGDLVFALHRRHPRAAITGIDLSDGMLSLARRKLAEHEPPADPSQLRFMQADCMDMPFDDDTFDLVTVAYGVRNFEDTRRGYAEMLRVLRPGGVLCVVELSEPTAWLPRMAYKAYTRGFIPVAGRLLSGDPRAYSYLHESIEAAPQRAAMTGIMTEAGLRDASFRSVFPGAVCIYLGSK